MNSEKIQEISEDIMEEMRRQRVSFNHPTLRSMGDIAQLVERIVRSQLKLHFEEEELTRFPDEYELARREEYERRTRASHQE